MNISSSIKEFVARYFPLKNLFQPKWTFKKVLQQLVSGLENGNIKLR